MTKNEPAAAGFLLSLPSELELLKLELLEFELVLTPLPKAVMVLLLLLSHEVRNKQRGKTRKIVSAAFIISFQFLVSSRKCARANQIKNQQSESRSPSLLPPNFSSSNSSKNGVRRVGSGRGLTMGGEDSS